MFCVSVCVTPDQHRPPNPGADQTKREDSHGAQLRRGSEDRLRPDGTRLVSALSPLGHVQDSTGKPRRRRLERVRPAEMERSRTRKTLTGTFAQEEGLTVKKKKKDCEALS